MCPGCIRFHFLLVKVPHEPMQEPPVACCRHSHSVLVLLASLFLLALYFYFHQKLSVVFQRHLSHHLRLRVRLHAVHPKHTAVALVLVDRRVRVGLVAEADDLVIHHLVLHSTFEVLTYHLRSDGIQSSVPPRHEPHGAGGAGAPQLVLRVAPVELDGVELRVELGQEKANVAVGFAQ